MNWQLFAKRVFSPTGSFFTRDREVCVGYTHWKSWLNIIRRLDERIGLAKYPSVTVQQQRAARECEHDGAQKETAGHSSFDSRIHGTRAASAR